MARLISEQAQTTCIQIQGLARIYMHVHNRLYKSNYNTSNWSNRGQLFFSMLGLISTVSIAFLVPIEQYRADETAVHICSSYLHCSYSGEAGCAHACSLWPNRGVEYGWFVP